MIRTYKTEGIIINRRNVGEADRLLTVFTRDHGKLSVKAKGIRRVPSRRSAHVELLNTVILTLYQASRSPILTEATATDTCSDLKEDLQKIGFAYHICELVDGLCPENQEHHQVYFLLKNTLHRLSRCNSDLSQEALFVIHEFEVTLLTLLGYWHTPQAASLSVDTHSFIESILERRLKSRAIFMRLDL
ncbi:MAG: DNA repair protein RecO [bacterium]|nr:DNA repair protein RecO [bacterium]